MTFQANVSGIRTTMGGGFKVTLDIADLESAKELLELYLANVQVALVRIPE